MADNTSDLIALQKGIARLRKSNRWLTLGLSDSDFNNPDIQEYLLRPLGTDIDKDIETENKLKAAVYLSVRRSKWKPRGIAKKLAESSVEALRDARLMSLYESEQITAKQYHEELENNQISKIATTFTRVKKRYGKKLIKGALKGALTLALGSVVGSGAGLIAGSVLLVSEIIPKKTKQKIKKTITRTIKRTGESITRSIENLCDRAAAAAPKIVKKFNETIERVSVATSRIVEPIRDVVSSVGSSIKKGVKKVLNWFGL